MALNKFQIDTICMEHLAKFLIKAGWQNVRFDEADPTMVSILMDGKNSPNAIIILKDAVSPDKPQDLTEEEKIKISSKGIRLNRITKVAFITIDENENLVGEIIITMAPLASK